MLKNSDIGSDAAMRALEFVSNEPPRWYVASDGSVVVLVQNETFRPCQGRNVLLYNI